MQVTVLGAGRVGAAIARDLAADEEFEVTVADVAEGALERLRNVPRLGRVHADFGRPEELTRILRDQEVVVGAVPGEMGFSILRQVLSTDGPPDGRRVVDISFFAEDAFELDALARERGAVVVVDCGIAPGCSNLLLGRLEEEMELERFVCHVGGLPVERRLPYEYKAPFSPLDVFEEYTRPARLIENGQVVVRPALSEPELVEVEGVGTLEAFNTDGLRTLLQTTRVPHVVEKTLRYPGHREKMQLLRDSGFFSREPVTVGGTTVTPLALTARLLMPLWHYGPGEEDLTAMRVVAEGREDGRRMRRTFELVDRYDRATGTSSMARTTGYTCTAAVRLLASGRWNRSGITPPETIGRDAACCRFILDDLAKRRVIFHERREEL